MFPLTPIYLWTLGSDKKFIFHQGGTNSGKTYSILMVLLTWAMRNDKVVDEGGRDTNTHIQVYVGNISLSHKAGALKDFLEIMDRWELWGDLDGGYDRGYKKKTYEFKFKSGSTLQFLGTSSLKEAREGKHDIVYFNEVNGIDYAFYHDVSIRTKRKVIVDYNSDSKFYIHDELEWDRCLKWSDSQDGVCEIYKDESDWTIDFYITNYTHNVEVEPELDSEGNWIVRRSIISDSEIATILENKEKCEKMRNPYFCNRWRVLGLGLTGGVMGLVYPHVNWISEDEFWVAWENGEHRGYGFDYGYAKAKEVGVRGGDPSAITQNVIWDGRVYSRLVMYKWSMRSHELAQELNDMGVGYLPIIMDRSQAMEVYDYLEEHGFNMIASLKQAGSVLKKIKLLQEHSLFFVDDKNYRHEVENKKWRKVNGEYSEKINPIDGNDHALDSLKDWRWMIMSHTDEYDDYEIVTPISI